MNHSECEQLDDYLARGLSGDQSAAFEAHWPNCPACRQAVEQQRKLADLLCEAVGRLDPVPADLLPRIEGRIRRAQRRRLLGWGGSLAAAAAALVVLLVGGWWGVRRQSPQQVPQAVAIGWHALRNEGRGESTNHALRSAQGVPPDPLQEQPQAEVTMVDPSSAIVVPVESNIPNVTIVWIYPTVKQAPADFVPDSK